MAANASPPLVARSVDGSLVGIHPIDPSSTSKNGLIRCYDGSVSNGSLKFTLRFPLSTSSSSSDDGVPGTEESRDELRKLVFASSSSSGSSPGYLCGMRHSSSSVLVWDLDRGVLSATVDVRSASAATPKKKKRKSSSSSGGGNEVLCDVATVGNQMYALVLFPHESGGDNGNGGGKTRLYQYELSSDGVRLVKKIKVGSFSNGESGGTVFGVTVSNKSMVVRMGNNVRVLDTHSGERLCKMDIPSDASSSGYEEGDSKSVPLSVSSDGRYIVTSTDNNGAILLSCTKDGEKHSLKTLAVLSGNDDSPMSHLDITSASDGVTVVAFQPASGSASLYSVATKSHSSVPQTPKAQLQTAEHDKSLSFIGAGFHPRTPNEALLLLFQRAKRGGGSAAGSGTSLPMESMSYADLEETVIVGASLAGMDGKSKDGKKRKAEDVALVSGDQGREASSATDLTTGTKKSKTDEDEEDDFGDMEEEEGEAGQSIAERLALLSSAMEQTDEEDDEDDTDGESTKPPADASTFKLKSATSETLTALLTQALSSNDPSQLNVALQVTDRRLVDGTVRSLQSLDARREPNDAAPGYLSTLLAHIVRRMARRHSLVMPLGVWVKAVLAATARSSTAQMMGGGNNTEVEERMAREGREMALKLGPLKNFLNERVECFPQLLRLEGRLALLSQQL